MSVCVKISGGNAQIKFGEVLKSSVCDYVFIKLRQTVVSSKGISKLLRAKMQKKCQHLELDSLCINDLISLSWGAYTLFLTLSKCTIIILRPASVTITLGNVLSAHACEAVFGSHGPLVLR